MSHSSILQRGYLELDAALDSPIVISFTLCARPGSGTSLLNVNIKCLVSAYHETSTFQVHRGCRKTIQINTFALMELVFKWVETNEK